MTEWISCKHKLPEPFVDVLVWCESTIKSLSKDEFYYAIDRICIWTDDYLPCFCTERYCGIVIAWMPLPKPPEEK